MNLISRMIDWPFEGLGSGQYGMILCDPPWYFKNHSEKGEGRNPTAHYDCMELDAIKALPVRELAADDCAILMWGIWPMLPQALDVMSSWGFTYKSGGAWAKQSSTGRKWAFGTGYCFRSASEFFLLGTIGDPKVMSKSIRNLIVSPVREHSRKPDDLHQMAESLYAGPYCELFARSPRVGWDVWGNEVNKFAVENNCGETA